MLSRGSPCGAELVDAMVLESPSTGEALEDLSKWLY